jgi:hypothetical protein
MDTLGDALPREIKRVREEVMPAYVAIGPPGAFARRMMELTIASAEKAIMEGDVVKMIHYYNELKGFTT